MSKFLLLFLAGIASTCAASAQLFPYTYTFNAGGNHQLLNNRYYEWSVGEMTLVETFSTPSLVVTQGVLQPVDQAVGISTIDKLQERLHLFPNPAQTTVNLEYALLHEGTLSYELQDVAGKHILNKQVEVKPGNNNIETIRLDGIANGSYMLNISYKTAAGIPEKTSFKIQKNEQ